MEECKRCGFYFSMNDLKEHLFNCNQGYVISLVIFDPI